MSEDNRETQERLLLISMPFPYLVYPSIQLGTLYSYLRNKGISVDVHHAYLRCGDILKPEWYHAICDNMPQEIFYSYFLFPENFEKYRNRIENYYNRMRKQFAHMQPISLKALLNRLSSFNEELLARIDFAKYSLVGFSITFDQLMGSVYLARKIKESYPNIQIVFGGANCTEDLGISLLKTFSEVDFSVSGEGEETLTTLFLNLAGRKFDKIKGLGWRENGTVRFNGPPDTIFLDNLPIPEYKDYFNRVEECSSDTKEFIKNNLAIPVEGSRGCWWRKCTFCSLNSQYNRYREKSIERIVYEVRHQVDRYKCHTIRFIDNVQRIQNFGKLMLELKNLNQDLNICLEIRAGHLKKEDYRLMRDAGVRHIQIGVEAFCNNMLKNMNKGVCAIENIAAIKYCQEFGLVSFYNIITNYPNEDQSDLRETARNVEFLKGFIPPMSVHPMLLTHGSPVYNNPQQFNIKEIKPHEADECRFPQSIRQTLTPLFYAYTCIDERKDRTSSWLNIFSQWEQTGRERIVTPLLFYQDSGGFLTITDKLSGESSKAILDEVERRLYLFCDSIQTKSNIFKNFPGLPHNHLEEILDRWITNRWMFKEGDKFLSLAVRLNSAISSVAYLSDYDLDTWKPPSPYWETRVKVGSLADLNLSLNLKKKPAWLKRLRDIVTFR